MPAISSSMATSKTPYVQVEIKGVAEVMRMLAVKKQAITDQTDAGVMQASNLMQQEVQESVIGNRSESKSVDTGRFGNSIEVNKEAWAHFTIKPEGTYPNGTPVQQVATWLEYGTDRILERRHFRNTLARKEKDVRDMIAKAIKQGTK